MFSDNFATAVSYLGIYVAATVVLFHGPGLLAARWPGVFGAQWLDVLRRSIFAVLNLVACYYVFFRASAEGWLVLAAYAACVSLHWVAVWLYGRSRASDERLFWAVLLYPLVFLVGIKTTSDFRTVIGVSYMAFRLSRLAMEMKGNPTLQIAPAAYLAFAFFLPTLSIGPINRYQTFAGSLTHENLTRHNLFHGATRVVIGFLKYKLIGNYVYALTFSGLWTDGFKHNFGEFLLSCVAYYVYLYVNFSGFCDIAIGAAAMVGIRVEENFNRHYVARNLQEFWSRWHVTLSSYLREVFFTPVTVSLMRRLPGSSHPHIMALAAFGTMFLIGLWHGIEPGYVIFGALQGIGLVAVYYYGSFISSLPREARRAYASNKAGLIASMTITHAYMALTLFFFENNTSEKMRHVIEVMR